MTRRLISTFFIITYFFQYATTSKYTSNSDIPCPELPNCTCAKEPHSSSYDLFCPTTEKPALEVRVYPPAFIYLTCQPSTKITDYDYVKGLDIGQVPSIYVQEHCPLPNISFAELTKNMGFEITDIFAFTGPKPLNDSVQNRHLAGLTVRHLILSFDGITSIPEDLFQGLPNLTSFDLGGNKIRRLPKNLFKPVPHLKHIEFSNNDLDHLEDEVFANLPEISEINIRGNELKELPKNIFSGLTTLDNLDFSNNYLETLPVDIFRDLKNLRELQMDGNNFSKLPEFFIFDFPKLRKFSLESNKQPMILPDYFFSNLTGLEKVHMNHNFLISIPENFFGKCSSLKGIELLQSNFTTLPEGLFLGLVNLEGLNLGFNHLEDLPDNVFKDLGRLEWLRLDSNRLQSLSRNVFNGLRNLKKLDLKHNRISHLDGEAFIPLQELKVIDLSDNYISFKDQDVSPLRYCSNLEKIHLYDNSIGEIFIDWRLNLTKLQDLDLRWNKIQNLSAVDTYFFSNSVTCDLRGNNLSVIDFQNVEALTVGLWSTYPPHEKEPVPDFENIDDYEYLIHVLTRKEQGAKFKLEENPLHCDCRSYDFFRYLNGKPWPNSDFNVTLDASSLVCEEPQGLKGILAKDVNMKDLICPGGEQCPIDCGK